MTQTSFSDRVAIVGMSCTRFADHWSQSLDDLIIDAATGVLDSTPGVELDDIEAFWLGTSTSGRGGLSLSRPLKIKYKPVSRLENACATGSEALRHAAYAVASGAYDIAMAVGAEKLKDSDYSGLTGENVPNDGAKTALTAPARFAMLVPAYCKKYGVSPAELRDVMTHIARKNHANGALNDRAQFRREVTKEKVEQAPIIAGDLRVFDCSGVSDGAAAAIVVRAEDALKYTDRPLYIKALALAAGPGTGTADPSYDFTTFPEVVACAADAYAQAGVTDPGTEISLAEVHDCFTPTELVLMEDLGFSERGGGWKDVLDGRFEPTGALPVNIDGGLKSFGHPVGASGLRMLYEMWLQFRGEAGARQVHNPKLGLTQNLGGGPGECVSFISIVGSELG